MVLKWIFFLLYMYIARKHFQKFIVRITKILTWKYIKYLYNIRIHVYIYSCIKPNAYFYHFMIADLYFIHIFIKKKKSQRHCIEWQKTYCPSLCITYIILPQNFFLFVDFTNACSVVTFRKQLLGIASSLHIFIL